MKLRFSTTWHGVAIAVLAWPTVALAGAVTDGSVGPVQSLSGHFTIPQTLGSVKGANLFHSFATFGVGRSESATFTTQSAAIARVISRVTGGQPSAIYGPLSLQAAPGSSPDFFFINPAGVLFGAGAQIDVPGGFHVSTAQQIKFADGFTWDTGSPTSSGLTVAAPEAFGFLGGNARTAVRFTNLDADGNAGDSPSLTLPAGSSLTIAAGDVAFESTWLPLPAVHVQIAATGNAPVDIPVAPSAGSLATPLAGSIALSDSGLTTEAPGILILRGDSIDLFASYLGIDSTGLPADTEPGAIILRATGDLSIRWSALATATYCDARGSAIDIAAGRLVADGYGGITTQTQGGGAAGPIDIDVRGAIHLANGGSIISDSSGATGDAGAITVSAKSMSVDGESKITSTANFSAGSAGDVTVRAVEDINLSNGGNISSFAYVANDSGAVTLAAGGALTLTNGSTIDGGVMYSTGNARAMSIAAGILTIDGGGSYTGIDNSTAESLGQAGAVDINVTGALTMANGARIQSATLNGGNANKVAITAHELNITGSPDAATAITTDSPSGAGNAGDIEINATRVTVARAGQISSSTHSAGEGGTVVMNVGSLIVDGSGWEGSTAIASRTADGSGSAGKVTINATGEVVLRERGIITSRTDGAGAAGTVDLAAARLTIDAVDAAGAGRTGIFGSATANSSGQTGEVTISAGRVAMRNGGVLSLRNDATVADPGSLRSTRLAVAAGDLLLENSQITAAATGNANASDIDIAASGSLTLKSSGITTAAVDGNGGDIRIAGRVIRLSDSMVTTSVLGSANGNGGNIRIAGEALVLQSGFIQANTFAPLAQGGNIAIDTRLLLVDGGPLFIGGDVVESFRSGINVIQAAAPDGIAGELAVTTPELNLAGTLAALATPTVDLGPLSRSQCQAGTTSSFTLAGRGTLPVTAAPFGR